MNLKNIKKSTIFFGVFTMILHISACKNKDESNLNSSIGTFASGPLMDGQFCDIEKISCKLRPDLLRNRQWLSEYLKENTLGNPEAPNRFIRYVQITRKDIEGAVHSCDGESCEARFEKSIALKEIGSMDIPLHVNAKVKMKYLRGKDEKGQVAMHRLSLSSGGMEFDIGEFTEISAKASMIFDARGTGTDLSKLEYRFSFGGELTAKLPYLSFGVQIDERGIGFSSAMSPNFKGEFMSLKLPVISGSHFIAYSEISSNFRKAVREQSYDPATSEYWDQFADRLAEVNGY